MKYKIVILLTIVMMAVAPYVFGQELLNQSASIPVSLPARGLVELNIVGYVDLIIESGEQEGVYISPYLAREAKITPSARKLTIEYKVTADHKNRSGEQIRVVLPSNQIASELTVKMARKRRIFHTFKFTSALTMQDVQINRFSLSYSDNQKIVIANSTIKNLELKGSGNGEIILHNVMGDNAFIYNSGKQKMALGNLTFLHLNHKSSGSSQIILDKSQIKNMTIDNSGSQTTELEATPLHFLQVKNSGSNQFITKNSIIKDIDIKSSGSFKGNFNLDNNASHTIKSNGSMRLVIESDCRINLNNSGSLVINDQRYSNFKGRLAIVL